MRGLCRTYIESSKLLDSGRRFISTLLGLKLSDLLFCIILFLILPIRASVAMASVLARYGFSGQPWPGVAEVPTPLRGGG